MPNWIISLLDSIFATKPKDPAMPALANKPICSPDPAVLLACKIAQHYEGCPKNAEDMCSPYLDPAGIPTIGWGSTYYENGSPVTMEDAPISEARAKILLYTKMEGFISIVDQCVDVPLNSEKTAALGDLAYNIGPVAFEKSTLLRLLNQGQLTESASQFLLWDHAGDEVLPGLEARRRTEQELFLTGKLNFES